MHPDVFIFIRQTVNPFAVVASTSPTRIDSLSLALLSLGLAEVAQDRFCPPDDQPSFFTASRRAAILGGLTVLNHTGDHFKQPAGSPRWYQHAHAMDLLDQHHFIACRVKGSKTACPRSEFRASPRRSFHR